jgi:ferritin
MIASHMDSLGLKVLAAKFFQQSEEEREHAMKFLNYLLSAGCTVRIPAVASPGEFSGTVLAGVELALKQELEITRLINGLLKLAHEENDYATASFLKWFIDEQVEEVSMVSDLIQLIKHAGEHHLLMVENRLMHQGIKPIAANPESGE